VGYCGAAGALHRGWEVVAAAVDGEQELRRRSGGGELGKERGEQNGCVQVQEQVHEELQDVLRVQKKSRSRRSSCWRPAGCVAARAAAALHGGARRGPARGGERRRGRWGGTWHRGEQCGSAGARHMAGEGGGVHGREQSRGGGAGG
jgi:hypothetical protein